MTLEELQTIISGSVRADWQELTGPTLIYALGEVREGDAPWRVTAESHHGRATLKTNLDVGLAWGLPWAEDFSEPWTQNFADSTGTGHYADVLWRGTPVLREHYVAVDGGRYALPLPIQNFEELAPSTHVLMPYTITPWQESVIRLVHGLSATHDYDEGLRRAGIGVER